MPVVSRGEKMFMYALVGAIDLTQIILSLFIVTEPVNHIIDVGVGAGLIGYGIKRKLFNTNKVLVLGATFFAEQIPFVNALPFWTYDLHNLYKGTTTQSNQVDIEVLGPLNSNGMRRPANRPEPRNKNGVRRPELGVPLNTAMRDSAIGKDFSPKNNQQDIDV